MSSILFLKNGVIRTRILPLRVDEYRIDRVGIPNRD